MYPLIEVIYQPDFITLCCSSRDMVMVDSECGDDKMILCAECGDHAFVTDAKMLRVLERHQVDFLEHSQDRIQQYIDEEQYELINEEKAAVEAFTKKSNRAINAIRKRHKLDSEDPNVQGRL